MPTRYPLLLATLLLLSLAAGPAAEEQANRGQQQGALSLRGRGDYVAPDGSGSKGSPLPMVINTWGGPFVRATNRAYRARARPRARKKRDAREHGVALQRGPADKPVPTTHRIRAPFFSQILLSRQRQEREEGRAANASTAALDAAEAGCAEVSVGRCWPSLVLSLRSRRTGREPVSAPFAVRRMAL